MNPITFCIPTAKNEKEYIKLLLNSLKENTQIHLHEILVFIDTDNQNTYDALLEYKNIIPELKIYKNPNHYPVGGQHNISVMFNAAKNDIVCYLQSDMVVGPNFDEYINNNMISKETILSCARIEPPLHPASPDKIVKNFGITPEEFKKEEFYEYVKDLQKENRSNIEAYFAPFAIFKEVWMDYLGGFDTQFRCSREDSDFHLRANILKLKLTQCWGACVYHFTCVSSRGNNWWEKTSESDYKNELQQLADLQEIKKFIRKWGYFDHHPQPSYNITFNIHLDRFVNFDLLKNIEPYCKKMYLSDANVTNHLISQLEFDTHYYSNLRWNYPHEYWLQIKHLFNNTDFNKRIEYLSFDKTPQENIIISFIYSDLVKVWSEDIMHFIKNLNLIIDQNDIGIFNYSCFTIEIKNKIKTINNLKNDILILKDNKFDFK